MTTFEQNKELNRFVDPSIPLTWNYRWSVLKLVLPLLVFSSALYCEIILFHAWLADGTALSAFGFCITITLVLFAFVFFSFEMQMRIGQRSKRKIELQERGVIIAQRQTIRWGQIVVWQFEPIPGFPEYSKLTIAFVARKSPRRQRYWQMVLDKPAQVHGLISELELQKQRGQTNYEIKILNEPARLIKPRTVSTAGVLPYLSGLFFLIHGVPMLISGLEGGHEHSDGNSRLTPAESEKLARFVLSHFSNANELKHFTITAGSVLTATGLALLIWGWILIGRDRKKIELEKNP